MYDFVKKNIGELTYKTDAKGESIETEIIYNTSSSSENSLMYFFDLFDGLYKIDHENDKKETSF